MMITLHLYDVTWGIEPLSMYLRLSWERGAGHPIGTQHHGVGEAGGPIRGLYHQQQCRRPAGDWVPDRPASSLGAPAAVRCAPIIPCYLSCFIATSPASLPTLLLSCHLSCLLATPPASLSPSSLRINCKVLVTSLCSAGVDVGLTDIRIINGKVLVAYLCDARV